MRECRLAGADGEGDVTDGMHPIDATDLIARAVQSEDASYPAPLSAVTRLLAPRHPGGGTLLDVGCGRSHLSPALRDQFDRYLGADILKYHGFPYDRSFHPIDLGAGQVELPGGVAEVVCAVETAEHMENPRVIARELTRLSKPGRRIVVTIPNHLIFLGKLTLITCNEFNAFRADICPVHFTALLEIDLGLIARERRWTDVEIDFTKFGRIPRMASQWPGWVTRLSPRRYSDNVLITGRRGR